ncbi:FMN-dependent NADH-azoreductase [Agrobacterium rhizogenes]|uniref:FMN dependent NADH:quinone oxidoreductase n=1 Tax=Rhizobium rhizogenes NBRC 13257 TaxID=1220581 RepID=A0AA87U8A1_RHIRH|nr:NAD(P)H-dependent oxidoreductase [Rhizobium rhizogenes]NTG65093.1 FMN-dependent NADH-azoreductase [Rhizobium rhizogenes]NTG71544.1 FMN-dependent NADH-azoreductase [Rhizobium rhizogenes]NTG84443.1 FMN-dependent NADH-azoreductase [Rhizobium rhizogenes]NTG90837.1 FMN-dependent NADH-azoreductase [Rhizobium rhizogenes]NTH29471.1 FMN-dependent NADH-azoreductase [Rhizobium rhizogenes]
MNILHIDSSITGENSISRQLSASTISNILKVHPDAHVVYRDLVAAPLDHYRITDKPGNSTAGAAFSAAILTEFLAADTIVIGAPLYNFTVSSQLKAWIDRIVINDATFKLGPEGSAGLVGEKRVILLVSRGAVYQPGTSWAPHEHAETFLRAIFGFIGIEPDVIVAEGAAYGPESRAAGIKSAEAAIASIAA